jgi:uroporphyrinogen decarboxylase
MVDCDGDVSTLIPLFLEGGVNCMYPFEARANMDAVAIREQYGQRMSIICGIDKTALIKGREEIAKEVESKVLPLAKTRGYIPSVDHGVPSDVSFQNYAYYIELLGSSVTKV